MDGKKQNLLVHGMIRGIRMAVLFLKANAKIIGKWCLSFLPVFLVCIHPVLFLYVNNTYNVNLTEAFYIALVQVLIGGIVFALSSVITKKRSFSSVFSTFFMLLFLNFNLIANLAGIIAPSWQRGLSAIIYVAVLGILCFVLIKARKAPELFTIQKILTAVFAILIVVNIISLIPFEQLISTISSKGTAVIALSSKNQDDDEKEELQRIGTMLAPQLDAATEAAINKGSYDFSEIKGIFSKKKPTVITQQERAALASSGDVLPNFYWIILDEAADFYSMEKYYGYDCEEINRFLIDNHFNINYNCVNRSAMTYQIFTDLCSLAYTATDKTTTQTARYYRYNAEMYYALNSLGYDVFQVSSDPSFLYSLREITQVDSRENLFASATMVGKTQLDIALDNTPISLLNLDVSQFTINTQRIRLQRVWDFYENPNNYYFDSSVAIVSHIMCPHIPFCYQADGSLVPHEGNYNWEDPQYYLGQYIYTMGKMETILSNLIQNDPNCVIVLCSDHGARPRADDRHTMEFQIEEVDMRRTLAAVYFGGKNLDIEGLSLVNTLRYVMTELGCDYPQITEEPAALSYPYLAR